MCKGTRNIKASVSKQGKFHHAVIDIRYDWNTILREGVRGSGLGNADECSKCIQNVTFQLSRYFLKSKVVAPGGYGETTMI